MKRLCICLAFICAGAQAGEAPYPTKPIALAATPQVKGGKVRALGITSAKRSPVAPEAAST